MKTVVKLLVSIFALYTAHSFSQEEPPYEGWLGGFSQYTDINTAKIEPNGGLDTGNSFGAELGFRFDQTWGIRFEANRIFIDPSSQFPNALSDDGHQFGGDVLYFLKNDLAYLYTGLKQQSLNTESYRMANVGIGKHWKLSKNLRLVTEATMYHDLGQSYKEYGAKLGLVYAIGVRTPIKRPDSDNDGIYDAVDRCPHSLPGAVVDATGCDVDMDGDGVLNDFDQCPLTPVGAKVKPNGCSFRDIDNDGIADEIDQCNDTIGNQKINEVGCYVEQDSDFDGIVDSQDKCTEIAHDGDVDADGCPTFVEQVGDQIIINILFKINSSKVNSVYESKISELALIMKRNPYLVAILEGHSSAIGPVDYNQYLSEQRAKAVYKLLTETYGVASNRVIQVGFGEMKLLDTDNTPESHKVNQRTEVKVKMAQQ